MKSFLQLSVYVAVSFPLKTNIKKKSTANNTELKYRGKKKVVLKKMKKFRAK